MLVVGEERCDRTVRDLPGLIETGDVIVVNDVHVHPARLRATRATGGGVEVLLVRPDDGGWTALVRPSRKLRPGERLVCGPGGIELVERRGETWLVRLDPDADTLTTAAGEVPLPPYFGRRATRDDEDRYQTVYARRGPLLAAAAPTAGLHLTEPLMAALTSRGARIVPVTLEVGLGTFQPLREEQLRTGRLHEERYVVPRETWEAVACARRVIAIGTTAMRVLESARGPGPGATDLFIREGFRFRRVGALLTNFHLPGSSLLMLVCAFGGSERIRRSYDSALTTGFRFYSYGDCMWVTPGRGR